MTERGRDIQGGKDGLFNNGDRDGGKATLVRPHKHKNQAPARAATAYCENRGPEETEGLAVGRRRKGERVTLLAEHLPGLGVSMLTVR